MQAFPKYHPETNDCIQQRLLLKVSHALTLKYVNSACSASCADLDEVDAWDSFSVNNTAFICLSLTLCKLSGSHV